MSAMTDPVTAELAVVVDDAQGQVSRGENLGADRIPAGW